jgi:hypothetical protein
MKYINRNLDKTIVNLTKVFRVIGLTGPRQSGKSTTIRHLFKDKYQYVSFEKSVILNEFHSDPVSFMKSYNKYIIFDEVQNVPEIFSYIKTIVDEEPDIKGRFILTGSSQFTLNKNITETLAGRIGLITLLPLDFNEIEICLREKSIFSGSYPELINNLYEFGDIWYDSYIKTYIERDVRKMQNIGDLRDFQRMLILISGYAGKQVNLSEISKQIGISLMTVKRWISVLEASYIIFFLSPYYKNFNKRITKTPKLYFYDTGLALFLMGLYGKIEFGTNLVSGQIFENYIITEVIKNIFHNVSNKKIYYYRTSGGKEIDLIIETGKELILAEIKSTSTYNPYLEKDIDSLKIPAKKKIIIYRGESIQSSGGTKYINYKDFLSSDFNNL